MNYHKRATIIVNGEKITGPVYLLNTISIWAMEAANHYRSIGANALADLASDSQKEIYTQLERLGLYKE